MTFKPQSYTLTILKENGDVFVNPILHEYPHGGEVVLTANPKQGYRLYDWRGDLSGLGITLRFSITRNMTIQANFQPLFQPITIQVANSTPATSFAITIPSSPSLLHLLQSSDDLIAWRNLRTVNGTTLNNVPLSSTDGEKEREFFRCSDVQIISTPPFLVFPVTNSSSGKRWTSRNTHVSSIFDHHGPPYERDGVITTYAGESVKISKNNAYRYAKGIGNLRVDLDPGINYFKSFKVVGYQREFSKKLPLIFEYTDPDDILWYDGHSGYDYAVADTEDVVAAAEGYVLPEESDDCYNAICIDHGNGYRTYYLHLSVRDKSKIEVGGVVQRVHVMPGDIIGKPGNISCGDSIGVHLHFEVRQNTGDKWVAIDPYGSKCSNGDPITPQLWLNGH